MDQFQEYSYVWFEEGPSEEERQRKLKEMQEDAAWQDVRSPFHIKSMKWRVYFSKVEREKRFKEYQKKEKEEEEREANRKEAKFLEWGRPKHATSKYLIFLK